MSDVTKGIKELIEAHGSPPRHVYLDSENSGIILPEALKAMIDAYHRNLGHPSITHRKGWEAYQALYEAAEAISASIGSRPEELVFTHSGTEANNLAVLGSARANKSGRRKIIVSSIEHLSVVFPAEKLVDAGYKLVKIPVDSEGFVDLEALSEAVDKDTFLVSIGAVNHEIGTIQDLRAVSEIVKDKAPHAIIHSDAVDALGRIHLDVNKLGLDMATFSSHKVYGPKGAGALYVSENIKLSAILYGQLSTQRLWPGVENVPAIIGFATAVKSLVSHLEENTARTRRLSNMLIDGILSSVEGTLLNGPQGDRRAADNVNISFLHCEGEALTVELSLRGIYVSSGSACTTRLLEPSHVLLAIGRRYEEAHGSILMKITPMHSEEDIIYVLDNIPEAVKRIRGLGPLGREVA